MKKIVRIILVVTACIVSGMFSLDAKAASAGKGETVTVSFPVSDIYGCQGTLQYSNEAIIKDIKISTNMSGFFDVSGNTFNFSVSEKKAVDGQIKVTATIQSSAKVGEECVISVENYYYTNKNNEDISKKLSSKKITVTEKKKEEKTTVVEKKTKKSEKETVQVTDDSESLDYSNLDKQIAIAEVLSEEEYTKKTWTLLSDTLQVAKEARESNIQESVDTAAAYLEQAIEGLKKIDYSKLEKAVEEAENYLETDDESGMWVQLFDLLDESEELLKGNDQKKIDDVAKNIKALIQQRRVMVNEPKEEATVVEVEPTGDYCNIESHKVWPIAFFVSLVINFLLISVFVAMWKNKKVYRDDTPMVNYEISDDDE